MMRKVSVIKLSFSEIIKTLQNRDKLKQTYNVFK